MTPKAKEIYDQVKADAEKIRQDPVFQKIKAELDADFKKTGRINPDLVAKALGAKPLSEADERTQRRLNAMRGPL